MYWDVIEKNWNQLKKRVKEQGHGGEWNPAESVADGEPISAEIDRIYGITTDQAQPQDKSG